MSTQWKTQADLEALIAARRAAEEARHRAEGESLRAAEREGPVACQDVDASKCAADRTCDVCGVAHAEKPLSLCTRCRRAFYCGPTCQRAAWAGHKAACKADSVRDSAKMAVELAKGDPEAFYRVGSSAFALAKTPAAEAAAYADLLKAAELGHPVASYNIALMHEQGRGGRVRDAAAARSWYARSAGAGFAEAQFVMGTIALNGEGGAPVDFAAAVRWFRATADNKQAAPDLVLDARCNLAVALRKTGDLVGAFREMSRAADAGNPKAMVDVATALLDGEGCARDAARARTLLERAAALGSERAREVLQGKRGVHVVEVTPPSVASVRAMSVSQLREFLAMHDRSAVGLLERADLVAAALDVRVLPPKNLAPAPPGVELVWRPEKATP